jgi:hypothetical protein
MIRSQDAKGVFSTCVDMVSARIKDIADGVKENFNSLFEEGDVHEVMPIDDINVKFEEFQHHVIYLSHLGTIYS